MTMIAFRHALLACGLLAGAAHAATVLELTPAHDFGEVGFDSQTHELPGSLFGESHAERLTFSVAQEGNVSLNVTWYDIATFGANGPARRFKGQPLSFQLFDDAGALLGEGRRNSSTLASCFSNDPDVCNTLAWSYLTPRLTAGHYNLLLTAALPEVDQYPTFVYEVGVSVVPEPGKVALMVLGLAALGIAARRRGMSSIG